MKESFNTLQEFRERNVGFYVRVLSDIHTFVSLNALSPGTISYEFARMMRDFSSNLEDARKEFASRQNLAASLSIGLSDPELRRMYKALADSYHGALMFYPMDVLDKSQAPTPKL